MESLRFLVTVCQGPHPVHLVRTATSMSLQVAAQVNLERVDQIITFVQGCEVSGNE